MIGNLIILTRDKNRIYQAMKHQEQVEKYIGDNVLTQASECVSFMVYPHRGMPI